MKQILLMPLILLIFLFSGCGSAGSNSAQIEPNPTADNAENNVKDFKANLKITMLNVGQGDSFLIQTKTQNILIDTSDMDERTKLVNELDKAGVTTFDKIILTHPHADHIGGLEKLLKENKYTVKEVYDNGIASTSKLYQNYMKEIKSMNIPHKTLKAGEILDFGDNVKFEVLYPTKDLVAAVNDGKQKTDPNNESVVGRLVYKKFSMMFTGDAELKVESEVWADNDEKKLQSTILKAGHHGSYTASSENFVRVVKPEYVLISAGEPTDKRGGNTYGHPHVEPLQIYLNAGIPSDHILWTWKNGTVVVKTDGKNFSVTPEVKEDWVREWIAQKKAKK